MTPTETNVIKFTPKQAEAKRAVYANTIILYGGAIRGGKTWWLILMIWVLALRYPKSRWVILRSTYATLQQTTLVTFQNLLDNGLSGDVMNWKQSTLTATLHNGSEVFFMAESFDSDQELNRFKGLEINGAGVDEINEIQEKTFNKLIERSGSWQHSKGCPIKIMGTCNPTLNWVKDKFYTPWVNESLPKGWSYIPAKITDNPHLSKEYIESLELLPVFEYQCYVEGDWDAVPRTGGEFYKLFDHDRDTVLNTHPDAKYRRDIALHISFDFNTSPYMTCTIWQVVGKSAVQIDEICLRTPNNRTENVCREFIRRYPTHPGGLFVYGDPNGKKEDTRTEKGHNDYTIILRALAQYRPSLRVLTAPPPVAMRGNFINTVFSQGYQGLTLRIARRCTDSIKDYLYLLEASDGTKHKHNVKDPTTKVSSQQYGHTSDANDYFVCYCFQSEFNAYQKGGVKAKVTTGGNTSRNSH